MQGWGGDTTPPCEPESSFKLIKKSSKFQTKKQTQQRCFDKTLSKDLDKSNMTNEHESEHQLNAISRLHTSSYINSQGIQTRYKNWASTYTRRHLGKTQKSKLFNKPRRRQYQLSDFTQPTNTTINRATQKVSENSQTIHSLNKQRKAKNMTI